MLARMADNYDTQLRNLWRSLAMALDAAAQANNDYNAVRMKAGMAPFQAFHLSAAVPVEPGTGPKTGGVRFSADEFLDAAAVARGQAVDMAAARKLRLVERDRNR
jgi:hypothetical protein